MTGRSALPLKTFAIAALTLIAPIQPGHAAIFQADLAVEASAASTACAPAEGDECLTNYLSYFYSFQPGDIVDFGTMSFEPSISCDGRAGCVILEGTYTTSYVPISVATLPNGLNLDLANLGGCNANPFGTCPASLVLPDPTVVSLVFTIPIGVSGIQLEWSGGYEYTPPTPLPLPPELPFFIAGLDLLGAWVHRGKLQLAHQHAV